MITTDKGLARSADPNTSKKAADVVKVPKLIQQIYDVMILAGDYGCTSDDVGDALPHLGVQTYSPRFKQMVNLGMIEVTDETRTGRAGVQQDVRRALLPPFIPVEVEEKKTKVELLKDDIRRIISELDDAADQLDKQGPIDGPASKDNGWLHKYELAANATRYARDKLKKIL